MQSINITELFIRHETRRHARPAGEDNECKTVTKHQSTTGGLEDVRLKVAIRVGHKGDGSRNVDHRVSPAV